MGTKKLLLGLLGLVLLSSCYTEVILDEDYIVESPFNTDAALQDFDLWYVDINATNGSGEVPFLQNAFTLTFRNGVVYANNNIVGLGKTGNGLGVDVGSYATGSGQVEVNHDVYGTYYLDIYVVGDNRMELYSPSTRTSYFVDGYQRNRFDYDRLFYENLDYFLQEYEAWEKTYTSEAGALNEFDEESYLRFFGGDVLNFQSSKDAPGTHPDNLYWDYEGDYRVYNTNDIDLKTLTLDYDYLGNEYFEFYVIDDSTIELYHVDSQTVYEFSGRGYIQYLKSDDKTGKKRSKSNYGKMSVTRQRSL
ncbi:nicotinic acid mononucleotide adenyltransferase [Croceivirga sp. JEA036]|uniref:nicotinic acid mononucleotide adenyltransferase n=1 Tax=Croceivirga sp. JEA036 TaxID=2721162 RepID=UPI00143A0048|nr:nicotinic acid mononucleotide adenyltransferase [Croceivirga sp. JEA036]NJB36920.1 nicotinic acid mononucleotide adenyltransferase [Croceivirga sp. JEA036]